MVVVKIKIKAPVSHVFDVFTDFKNMEKRVNGIKKIEFLNGDGEAVLEMKWRETRIMFGKEATEEMWISEIKANETAE